MNNEPGTGSFPTMGTSAAMLSRTGKVERGRTRPRGNTQGGNIPGVGNKSNRSMSYERMGCTLHPTATLYAPNAASATESLKRVHIMPSRASWTDNWRSAARSLNGANY